ncbi:MAG: class I SAM-dependent methyltransferase [Magnetococcales bacterium]|nr:class I SAM-dependent methyltransferase [Magnetococcales bacterium]
MTQSLKAVAGTGGSVIVTRCQVCGSRKLQPSLFVGYLPPVNQMRPIGQQPHEQPAYPAGLLHCPRCQLVQLGLIVDSRILFPPDYPYTSGTTRVLHENFQELQQECAELWQLKPKDLVVDIGSNDGTLLSKFQAAGHPVLGIEPTDAGKLARERGIPTLAAYFTVKAAESARKMRGRAKVITAANCFAHIEKIHDVVKGALKLLDKDGLFITESHYLMPLLDTVQYDTIYHEHLRYYSLTSLSYLLELHDLEVVHAKEIPSHGGSIRVCAARKGMRPIQPSVRQMLDAEAARGPMTEQLATFKQRTVRSKLQLHALLAGIKAAGHRVAGVGAPSRASTLVNYTGLDDGILEYVLEVKGSRKIGRYLPGTLVPVIEESRLFEDQPEYALLFSWHIAAELMPKLRQKGYQGKFILPLPEPRIVE